MNSDQGCKVSSVHFTPLTAAQRGRDNFKINLDTFVHKIAQAKASPIVVQGGGAVSCGRGTPVTPNTQHSTLRAKLHTRMNQILRPVLNPKSYILNPQPTPGPLQRNSPGPRFPFPAPSLHPAPSTECNPGPWTLLLLLLYYSQA